MFARGPTLISCFFLSPYKTYINSLNDSLNWDCGPEKFILNFEYQMGDDNKCAAIAIDEDKPHIAEKLQ